MDFPKEFNLKSFKEEQKKLQKNELILATEPFYTIQGEGRYSGRAAFFIRTAYCSLKCSACDEPLWRKNKIITDFESIHKKMLELNKDCKLIIFSGGEPAMQLTSDFIEYFENFGYDINIETSGAVYNPNLELLHWVCCSPKRISDQFGKENILEDKYIFNWNNIDYIDEFKFIIDDRTNEKMLLDFVNDSRIKHFPIFYLSPWDYYDEEQNKKNYKKIIELVEKYPDVFRVSLQIHKILNIA